MVYRLLLDENVEHEVLYRLENYGHDVEHVDFVADLGKGTRDGVIAEYTLETDRLLVTYDIDFVLDLDPESFRGVLFVQDGSRSMEAVADIVHSVSKHVPADELRGVEYVGEAWL